MPRAALALALTVALTAGAAAAKPYKAPRNAAGQPDMQGIWTNTSATFLQRPPNLKNLVATEAEAAAFEAQIGKFLTNGPPTVDPNDPAPKEVKSVGNSDWIEIDAKLARVNGEIRTSWVVEPADGRIPLTDFGKKLAKERGRDDDFSGPEARPAPERCLTGIGNTEGPPMLNSGFNGHYQIVQTKDHVAILIEMNGDVRIIRLNDRTHPHPEVTKWMGDSVGWWEGDTLVVETTNLTPRGAYVWTLGGGFAYGPKAKVIERFTRTAKDQILYAFTIEDPEVFSKPWRAEIPFRPAKGPIYESACHEGNYSLPNILAGARAQEKAAAAAAK